MAKSTSAPPAAQATLCLSSYASATELQALERTTYGVEVERYNLKIPDDQKEAFADVYKQAIMADLREETKQALCDTLAAKYEKLSEYLDEDPVVVEDTIWTWENVKKLLTLLYMLWMLSFIGLWYYDLPMSAKW